MANHQIYDSNCIFTCYRIGRQVVEYQQLDIDVDVDLFYWFVGWWILSNIS